MDGQNKRISNEKCDTRCSQRPIFVCHSLEFAFVWPREKDAVNDETQLNALAVQYVRLGLAIGQYDKTLSMRITDRIH
jgi:hypothetical protein